MNKPPSSSAPQLIAIRDWFVASNQSLAVAESVTAGRVQALLTSESGASDFFFGGITTYNMEQKVRHLGVDRLVAMHCNSVSEQTVAEMALGTRRLFQSDWSLATTGYAEPDAARGIATPFSWIGIADHDGRLAVQRVEVMGTRSDVQMEMARAAIRLLQSKVS